MFKSSALAKLQEQIDALKAEAETHSKSLQEKIDELAKVQDDYEKARLQVEALTKEKGNLADQLATATTQLTEANKKLEGSIPKAEFDKKVEDLVIERCAAAGIAPIKREASDDPKDPHSPAPEKPKSTGLARARELLAERQKKA